MTCDVCHTYMYILLYILFFSLARTFFRVGDFDFRNCSCVSNQQEKNSLLLQQTVVFVICTFAMTA